MSAYLNRKSLIGCTLVIGLLGGVPFVLAGVSSSEHSPSAPASSTDQPMPTQKSQTNESKTDHGSMDHSKMSEESMDHDKKTKKTD
ncbi:hypothetical protein [Pseudomonas fluorescens]|uniref:Uncharacterized protein n=1 Tax=Pseudomonas fluorescens TaxID=294 RepID=A0A5E7EJM5_PSEFL|nr:hypothetical protein [Pseudomonas fluorescens]VVO26938.1 hypothetical protein PS691_04629 [Pseudomonas fluorescens]